MRFSIHPRPTSRNEFASSLTLNFFFLVSVLLTIPSSGSRVDSKREENSFHHQIQYKTQKEGHSHILKVLNLNAWGLTWPWSKDRTLRMRALSHIIYHSDYDVVLLQEIWYRKDYDIIKKSAPYVTHYDAFNVDCKGYLLPFGCSGLAILSRHPIVGTEFRPFSKRGSFWNFDGEYFVSKGVGRASIYWKGYTVDVFTTHLISYTNNPNRDNTYYRFLQSQETAEYIRSSTADIKLFGGDLNALPMLGSKQPYGILRSLMNDALTDKFPGASFHPWFATYGNRENTYSSHACPERIDYIMFWYGPDVSMRTTNFYMPMIMAHGTSKRVSISDHQGLHAEFQVQRLYHSRNDTSSIEQHYARYNQI